jgi:hypothetical protein
VRQHRQLRVPAAAAASLTALISEDASGNSILLRAAAVEQREFGAAAAAAIGCTSRRHGALAVVRTVMRRGSVSVSVRDQKAKGALTA